MYTAKDVERMVSGYNTGGGYSPPSAKKSYTADDVRRMVEGYDPNYRMPAQANSAQNYAPTPKPLNNSRVEVPAPLTPTPLTPAKTGEAWRDNLNNSKVLNFAQNLLEATNPLANIGNVSRYVGSQVAANEAEQKSAENIVMNAQNMARLGDDKLFNSNEYQQALNTAATRSLIPNPLSLLSKVLPKSAETPEQILSNKQQAATERLLEGKTGLSRDLTQAAVAGANMLGTAGVAAMSGLPFLGVMAAQSGAQTGQAALDRGESASTAATLAAGSGAITAGIESFGGVAGSWGNKAARGLAKTAIGQRVLSSIPKATADKIAALAATKLGGVLGNSASEATEEFAEYYAQAFFNNLIADEKTPTDVKEALQNAKIGGLVGGVFGGARAFAPRQSAQPVQNVESPPAQTAAQPLALPPATDFYASPNGQIKTDLRETIRAPRYTGAEKSAEAFQPLALPAAKDFYAAPNGIVKTNLQPTLRAPSFRSEYFAESPLMRNQPQEISPTYSPVNAVQMLPRSEPIQPEPLRGARYRAVNSIFQNQDAAPVYSPVQSRQVLTPNPLRPTAPAQAAAPALEPIPLTNTQNAPQAKSTASGANINHFISPELRQATNKIGEAGRKLYRQMVSGQAPLERMAKAQKGLQASTAEELIQQIRNAGGTVDYSLESATVDRAGNPLDVSWKQMVDMPEAELRQLDEYMQNLHNIDRQAQGKPVLKATAEESAAKVAQMNAENPKLAAKAKQIQAFWDKFMQEWAVNGNLLSAEQYQAMREMYPNYIPTFRVDKDISGASHIASGRQIGTAKTIKRAKGGTSEVKAFEDNFADQIRKFIKAERKNELFLNLVDFARNHPEAAAPYAKIVPSDTKVDTSDGYTAFVDDLDAKSLQEVQKGVYRLTAFEDGKPVSLDVSQEVFDALNDLLNPKVGFGQQAGRAVTSVPKSLITGNNPFFAITNIIRDVQTGYVNSITSKKTFVGYLNDLGKAAVDMANNTPDWQLYQANGGARSGFFQNNKGFKESVKQPSGLVPRALNRTGKAFSWPGEQSEQVTRFSEFQNGLKKYGRSPEGIKKAMQAAADVTVNFSRNGPTMKAIDSWVMYANAQMQGLDKMARQIKSNPIQTARRTTEIIAIPAAILFLINSGNPYYDDLDDGVKDDYFLIPNLSDRDESGYAKTFYRLPKSREYGVLLGGMLERAARTMEGENAEDAFSGYGESLAKSFMFSNPATENVLAPFLYNLPQNKSWAGSAIVPQSMESLEPRYQYDYSTSEIGKAIGDQFNWSPKKVDYVLDQYSGVVGDVVLPLTTGANRTPAERLKAVANPIRRKFVADPLYSSAPVGELYGAMDDAKSVSDTKYFVEDIPKEMVTPEKKRYWYLNRIADQIADLRKQERELLSGTAPEAEIRAIRQRINDLARNSNKNSQAFMEEYKRAYSVLSQVDQSAEFQKLDADQKGKIWGDMDTYATAMSYPGYDAPSWVGDARQAISSGIPATEYFLFRRTTINTTADKDSDGKAITGSRKNKIADYLDGRNLTEAQRNYLLGLEYKPEQERQLSQAEINRKNFKPIPLR